MIFISVLCVQIQPLFGKSKKPIGVMLEIGATWEGGV